MHGWMRAAMVIMFRDSVGPYPQAENILFCFPHPLAVFSSFPGEFPCPLTFPCSLQMVLSPLFTVLSPLLLTVTVTVAMRLDVVNKKPQTGQNIGCSFDRVGHTPIRPNDASETCLGMSHVQGFAKTAAVPDV